jgi:ribonuclease HI
MKGYFDGASRGNPGEAGAGALLEDERGQVAWETAMPLGVRTNNEAEYLALILLLEEAARRGLGDLDVYGDSRLVVSQVSGSWKINEPRLRELATRVWALCEGRKVRFSWIPRERNTRADALSNQALDGPKKPKGGLRWVHEGIALATDPDGQAYAVDIRHGACTCREFQASGTCRHLAAAAVCPERA